MIKLENVVLASPEQMEFIIQGMRNPMNSWDKSDSSCGKATRETNVQWSDYYFIGTNDASLMQRLANAGTDHRKFMRMMPVYVRITAPLYWQFFLPMKHFSQLSLGVAFAANGEPPIGIPWETHLYFKCEPVEAIPYAFWAGEQGYY